jgi:hypothetical protein
MLDRVHHQLLRETDYQAEAAATAAYRQALGDDPVLWVPAVHADHCGDAILATDFAPGVPVDRLATAGTPAQRDAVATALVRLAAHELFGMQLVQTDPNFSNYLHDAASGRVALLDFGAAEAIAPHRVQQLRCLGRGLRDGDAAQVRMAALALGYVGESVAPHERRAHAGGFVQHLDHREALEDLFPQDLQLHLGQAVAHAAVDAEAEAQVLARAGAVDDELVGVLDGGLVAVARQVPHRDLVALGDLLAAQLGVLRGGAAHVGQRRLPADDLGHQAVDQRRVGAQLGELLGVLFSASRPPVMLLRVVSLPPTISSTRLPMYSIGGMLRVAGRAPASRPGRCAAGR